MVKRTLKISLYSSIVLIVALLYGCATPNAEYQKIQNVPMLGTTLTIIADISADSLTSLLDGAMAIDSTMKAQMSIFDKQSLISRINRGEADSLTSDIIYNIRLADSVSRLSGGIYDITVLPLVEAWGFARKEALSDPNIDSLLEFVGYQKIRVQGGRIIKEDPRTRLDFNSIAKGYTVDKVAELVANMGAENYLVDIGGEINCRGVNSRGEGWTIGVESPIDGNMTDGDYLQKAIQISDQSALRGVATSGNYRRFYLNDAGEKICHTIDPTTGLSKSSTLLSVTVMAPTCALADAYATMFLAAGDQGAMALVQQIEGIEAYFIFSGDENSEYEYREYMTPRMEAMIRE
ncbi:MAG: FAD:protein FMN transferase [Rikenellaceae bacterium]